MRWRTGRKAITVIVSAAVLLVAGLTTAALANGHDAAAGDQGRGIAAGKFNINIAGFLNFHTKGDLRVIDQLLTVPVGGQVGWHSHPGPVLVVVKSGIFRSVQTDCSSKDYPAGSVYVDEGAGHVHNARNVGSVAMELSVTYLLPPGVLRRDNAPAINCPSP